MLTGVGIDIISMAAVARLWRQHGERFEEDLLTSGEHRQFREIPDNDSTDADASRRLRFLATRFAAKEAVVKALGAPHRVAYNWNDIHVAGEDRFTVELRGEVRELALSAGCDRLTGTVGGDQTLCVAIVVGGTA